MAEFEPIMPDGRTFTEHMLSEWNASMDQLKARIERFMHDINHIEFERRLREKGLLAEGEHDGCTLVDTEQL